MSKTREEWLKRMERRYAQEPTTGMWFRSLLGSEYVAYTSAPYEESSKGGLKTNKAKFDEQEALLIVMTACESEGGPLLFKREDKRDLLTAIDGKILATLYAFTALHCGITKAETPLEDVGKNSGTTSSDEQPS